MDGGKKMADQDQEQDNPTFASDQDQHDAMPKQMKDHMWQAFVHAAGKGPHPGNYKGPPHPGVPPDAVTEGDLQRVHEEGYQSSLSPASSRSSVWPA
jgi:hypothetical protein